MSDSELELMMLQPGWTLNVLYFGGAPGGFYELETRGDGVNLSYFGLMPHMIGRGVGKAMLAAAVQDAWDRSPSALYVNTCTADHPRALDVYLEAGFQRLRQRREVWDIPNQLNLQIPMSLRL